MPTQPWKPKQKPQQNMVGVTYGSCNRLQRIYSDPLSLKTNEINNNGYNPPKFIKNIERMKSKKGQGYRGPRNKNSQQYQDFLQKKLNYYYYKYL